MNLPFFPRFPGQEVLVCSPMWRTSNSNGRYPRKRAAEAAGFFMFSTAVDTQPCDSLHLENARQRLRQQCLARAGRVDQEDVRLR
jgi:hypothetical protein